MSYHDTIYALASAPGKAGVAVVRISGPRARAALAFLGVEKPLTPRMASLVTLTHHGAVLDHALALFFVAPHSFTGEDVVELHLHGGRAILRLVLAALSECPGLRMAEPGEFTRRAFLHNKLDLIEAESLADLIDADSPAQHAQAMRQWDSAAQRIEALREAVLTPLALLEAYIDFPDEEIPEAALSETMQRVGSLTKEIQSLLDDGGIGEKIREGLDIVIFGPPNAGKSSLLNALVKRDAAIVSSEAGTTRDLIEIQMEIGGYAVTLVDTAGLRETAGIIEAEGVRRAKNRLQNAAIKLAVFDIVTAQEQYSEFQSLIDESTLILLTKSDLVSQPSSMPFPAIPLSSQTGQGLEDLIAALLARIEAMVAQAPSPLITRARHREALTRALLSLQRFSHQAPLEIMCEELRIAANEIGKITGKIHVDALLDVIFSRFCIGK